MRCVVLLLLLFTAAAAIDVESLLRNNEMGESDESKYYRPIGVSVEKDEVEHWGHGSATSQGRRKYQEDRVLVKGLSLDGKPLGLFAVFDGHIGHEASEFLAANLWNELALRLKFSSVEDSLVSTLKALDDRFLKQAAEKGIPAGSTACVGLVTAESIVVANVGDSRAMLCKGRKQDGKVVHVALTKDDHPEEAAERRRIEAAGGFVKDGVINHHFPMSRAIGDLPMRRYGVISTSTTTVVTRNPDDHGFFVIVSDGILEGISEQDICTTVENEVKSGAEMRAIAQTVLNKASQSTDNLSIVIVPLGKNRERKDEL